MGYYSMHRRAYFKLILCCSPTIYGIYVEMFPDIT